MNELVALLLTLLNRNFVISTVDWVSAWQNEEGDVIGQSVAVVVLVYDRTIRAIGIDHLPLLIILFSQPVNSSHGDVECGPSEISMISFTALHTQ